MDLSTEMNFGIQFDKFERIPPHVEFPEILGFSGNSRVLMFFNIPIVKKH